jgi:phage baseplate assembly protein W
MTALYSDLSITFDRDPLSGDLMTVEDEAAVSQSIRTLILTSLYERPFQPSVGSVLSQLLFEPMTDVTKAILAQTIKDTIDQFEPRASLKYVDVVTNGTNDLTVDVGFFVHNRPNIVTTSIVLRRVR